MAVILMESMLFEVQGLCKRFGRIAALSDVSFHVEAGELLELFQWLTPEEAARRCAADPDFRRAVGEEMCDVMMYCISLANAMGFDIAQTIAAKMEKNRKKYPPEEFRGHYERPLK